MEQYVIALIFNSFLKRKNWIKARGVSLLHIGAGMLPVLVARVFSVWCNYCRGHVDRMYLNRSSLSAFGYYRIIVAMLVVMYLYL